MSNSLHHHRLVASVEVEPGVSCRRILNRSQSEALAQALAADLARTVPQASDGLLVVAGCLLEPAEVLRPGLGVWQALIDLSAPLLRQGRGHAELLAIGGEPDLPDARLTPPDQAPAGALLVIPMLLVSSENLNAVLEAELFERGSLHPPARAHLAESAQLSTQHGQLLTVHDLIALQHVQLDGAGLAAFWPVIEHAVLHADEATEFDLPAGLTARWEVEPQQCVIDFHSPAQLGRSLPDYLIWQRAYRTLLAILTTHGVDLSWAVEAPLTLDDERQLAQRQRPAQTGDRPGVTEHSDPQLGPIAWTVVAEGQRCDVYPLHPEALMTLARQFRARDDLRQPGRLCYNPNTLELEPANDQ